MSLNYAIYKKSSKKVSWKFALSSAACIIYYFLFGPGLANVLCVQIHLHYKQMNMKLQKIERSSPVFFSGASTRFWRQKTGTAQLAPQRKRQWQPRFPASGTSGRMLSSSTTWTKPVLQPGLFSDTVRFIGKRYRWKILARIDRLYSTVTAQDLYKTCPHV